MPLFSMVLSCFQWDAVESFAAETGIVQPGTGHEEGPQGGRAERDSSPPESMSTAPHVCIWHAVSKHPTSCSP